MRRLLIILATVIVVVGVGAGIYWYYTNQSSGIEVAPGTPSFPTAEEQQNPTTFGEDISVPTPVGTAGGLSARLVKVSAGPVVRGTVVTNVSRSSASSTPVESDVAIHYIERQSGNVFRYLMREGTITRISNKTIPGIEEAYWLPNASVAFVRYLSGTNFETINTYSLPATGGAGFFLPQNVSGIAVSSTSILTLTSSVNGSSASTLRTDGTRLSTVFTTPLTSLRVSFAGAGRYLAFTKPSATLAGNAFVVDAAGTFSAVAGPLRGLVALVSPSGKWVLVSSVAGNELRMQLVNSTTRESLPLPVGTIADKCVWTADSLTLYCGVPIQPSTNYAYPDDWYQGAVAFSDRIWKINVTDRYAQLVLDFSKEASASVDAVALAIDPLGTMLTFVNKNDGALWVYRL